MSQNKISALLVMGCVFMLLLIFVIGYMIDDRDLLFYAKFFGFVILDGVYFIALCTFLYLAIVPFFHQMINRKQQINESDKDI